MNMTICPTYHLKESKGTGLILQFYLSQSQQGLQTQTLKGVWNGSQPAVEWLFFSSVDKHYIWVPLLFQMFGLTESLNFQTLLRLMRLLGSMRGEVPFDFNDIRKYAVLSTFP